MARTPKHRRTTLALALALAGASLAAVGGAPAAQAQGTACPGDFRVLHNDHIGSWSVPGGDYRITILPGSGSLSCQRAANRFARFLDDYDGVLPGSWVLTSSKPAVATFTRATGGGFRVKPDSASGGGPTPGGGGRVYPSGQRCPDTFQVRHQDQIGALPVPAGAYVITVSAKGPACPIASSDLAAFLQRPDGKLPGGWRLDVGRGKFTNDGVWFRIEQATS
jgi:hypothetical protein